MSTTPDKQWKYLSRKPGSLYKQLFVTDRRISARQLYGQLVNEESPMTPEEIAADHGLPLEAVLEAIAYCQSDPPEIRSDWEAEVALAEATGMNDPNYKMNARPRLLSAQEQARLEKR